MHAPRAAIPTIEACFKRLLMFVSVKNAGVSKDTIAQSAISAINKLNCSFCSNDFEFKRGCLFICSSVFVFCKLIVQFPHIKISNMQYQPYHTAKNIPLPHDSFILY